MIAVIGANAQDANSYAAGLRGQPGGVFITFPGCGRSLAGLRNDSYVLTPLARTLNTDPIKRLQEQASRNTVMQLGRAKRVSRGW